MKCTHKTTYKFIEIDGNEAMFQCRLCGKIWWENIENREGNERFIAKNIPESVDYDENNILR